MVGSELYVRASRPGSADPPVGTKVSLVGAAATTVMGGGDVDVSVRCQRTGAFQKNDEVVVVPSTNSAIVVSPEQRGLLKVRYLKSNRINDVPVARCEHVIRTTRKTIPIANLSARAPLLSPETRLKAALQVAIDTGDSGPLERVVARIDAEGSEADQESAVMLRRLEDSHLKAAAEDGDVARLQQAIAGARKRGACSDDVMRRAQMRLRDVERAEGTLARLQRHILKALVTRKAALLLHRRWCDASVSALELPLHDMKDPDRFQGMDFLMAAIVIAFRYKHPVAPKAKQWFQDHMPAWWLAVDDGGDDENSTTLGFAKAGIASCPPLVDDVDEDDYDDDGDHDACSTPDGCTVDSAGRLWVHYKQGGDGGGGNGVFCPETRVTAQAAPPSGGGRARKRSSEWLALRREAWGWYYENLSIDVIEDYLQNEIASQDRNDAKRLLDWLLDFVVKTIEADLVLAEPSTLASSSSRGGSTEGDESIVNYLTQLINDHQTGGERTCKVLYDGGCKHKQRARIEEARFEGRESGRVMFRGVDRTPKDTYYKFDVGTFVRRKCLGHGWSKRHGCSTCLAIRKCPICETTHDSAGNGMNLTIALKDLGGDTVRGRARCWRWMTGPGVGNDKSISLEFRARAPFAAPSSSGISAT